ncbi:cytochrome b6f subunit family protein [Synechococcus sp. B60.2]|uniref:cytochrome b6f subunit PetP n=1 Tax=Synechococcus sp. B60.2 TaxID=2964523 RepID=UPI0039C28855
MVIKVGDKVKVRSIRDRGQEEVSALVGKEAVVLARRVVDGSGIGYILEFPDRSRHWFFESELEVVDSGHAKDEPS